MRKLMIEQRRRVEELLNTIKEEKNGYKLGKPWRHSDQALTCVVPILKTTKDHKREYITIAEAKKVAITDTGNINEAKVKNNEEVPIFIRIGELLTGDTQERAVTSSRIIFPGQEVTVPIACVHATKGIREGAELKFEGYAPGKEYSYIYNIHWHGQANQSDSWNLDHTYNFKANEVLHKYGFAPDDPSFQQQRYSNSTGATPVVYGSSRTPGADWSYWDTTTTGDSITGKGISSGGGTNFTFSLPSQSSSSQSAHYSISSRSISYDDLTAKHKQVNELLEDIIKKVPLFENQIGLALIDPDGFKCLDCYDGKLSYKAVKEALVGKETVTISDKDEENVFEYKPEVAKKTIGKALKNKFEENIVYEEENYKTITLDLEGYMGEAALLNNKIIHLVITRKELGDDTNAKT